MDPIPTNESLDKDDQERRPNPIAANISARQKSSDKKAMQPLSFFWYGGFVVGAV